MSSARAIARSATEADTVRKVRSRIIPFLFLLYIVAYLDRINIGFAALTMNRELAVSSRQFGLLAGVFFLGYFLFEVPSNLLLHRIGARIWIARILVSWGILAMLGGCVRSVAQLYVARFLLGLMEAGFFPGILLYLTYWFRQREQAQAIALFMAALPITSIVGAPVSGFILDHVHWLGTSSWRWLLILEGLPAILCGVLTYLLLPSRPVEATFLTTEERSWLVSALEREDELKRSRHHVSAVRALATARVWHLAAIGFFMTTGLYAVSFWMPQVVQSFSGRYSNTLLGLLVTIPQVVGLAAMVLVSRSSDRRLERRYHVAIPAILAGVALLGLGGVSGPLVSIALLSLVVAGIYSFYGPFFSLPSQFLTGFSAAAGIGLVNSVVNLGGFVGPYAIGAINASTGSLHRGLAAVGVSVLLSAALTLMLPGVRP